MEDTQTPGATATIDATSNAATDKDPRKEAIKEAAYRLLNGIMANPCCDQEIVRVITDPEVAQLILDEPQAKVMETLLQGFAQDVVSKKISDEQARTIAEGAKGQNPIETQEQLQEVVKAVFTQTDKQDRQDIVSAINEATEGRYAPAVKEVLDRREQAAQQQRG